jgi:hypothetical protein
VLAIVVTLMLPADHGAEPAAAVATQR